MRKILTEEVFVGFCMRCSSSTSSSSSDSSVKFIVVAPGWNVDTESSLGFMDGICSGGKLGTSISTTGSADCSVLSGFNFSSVGSFVKLRSSSSASRLASSASVSESASLFREFQRDLACHCRASGLNIIK